VAVLFITPKECGGGGQGKYLVENNGVVLDGLDTNEIALAIGKSASSALAKASA
jgi:hypothetical protein